MASHLNSSRCRTTTKTTIGRITFFTKAVLIESCDLCVIDFAPS